MMKLCGIFSPLRGASLSAGGQEAKLIEADGHPKLVDVIR